MLDQLTLHSAHRHGKGHSQATRGRLLGTLGLTVLAAALASPVLAQDATKPAEAASGTLATMKDKTSYATGVMTSRTLQKNQVSFDLELLIQGIRDGAAGGEIRMPEKELKLVLQAMQTDILRKLNNERQVKATLARENGLNFQTEYKKKPGVVVLPGNLMYRVIKEGKGDLPKELGSVVVRYRGTLIDGTEFDATPEGKTSTVKLTEVITGWREALKKMPAGSTWEIVIPPALAYATRGAGGIGPNETLVFNLELVAVVQ